LFLSTPAAAANLGRQSIVLFYLYTYIFATAYSALLPGRFFNVMLAEIVPKNKIAKCHYLEPGNMAHCFRFGACTCRLFDSTYRYYRHTDSYLRMPRDCICFFLIMLHKHLPRNIRSEMKRWESVKQGLHFVFKNKKNY